MAEFVVKPEDWGKNSLENYWLPMLRAQKVTAGGGSGLEDWQREEWLGAKGPVHSGPFPFPMAELDEGSTWKPAIRIQGLQNAVNFFYGLKGWTVGAAGSLHLSKEYHGAYYCLATSRLQAVQSCMASANGLGGKWRSFRNPGNVGSGLFSGKAWYETSSGKRTGYVYLGLNLWLNVYEKYKVHLGAPGGQEVTEDALLGRPLSLGVAHPQPGLKGTMFTKCRQLKMGGIAFELNLYDLCAASVYPDFAGWPVRAVKENTELWSVVDGLEFF